LSDPNPDPGNNANFYSGGDGCCFTIGLPYWRTLVGDFENSDSPYGTLDQGGNVWEWNGAILFGSYYGLRGGSFREGGYGYNVASLLASTRIAAFPPTYEDIDIGFRVSEVPEPASIVMLALASVGMLTRRRTVLR